MSQVERLETARAKVEDYLLNLEHPEGAAKAKFFLARGCRRDRPDTLADQLARQALRGWPGDVVPGLNAMKHRIVGPISCPDGRDVDILTVWQVKAGSMAASLVTARPYRRKAIPESRR